MSAGRAPMSRVAVIFTGGTISMVVDAAAGGKVPTLDGAAILARAPGIESIADLVPVDLGRTPASHFTFPKLFEIAGEIRRWQADPSIDGVVVVQGTDVIEETAFLWDLVLDGETPVIVTGAMRAASDPNDDGPENLRNAVRCAAARELRGAGVLVVLDGTINPADAVTKTHATALDTFQCLDVGPLGHVRDGRVVVRPGAGPRRHVATDRAVDGVALLTAHVAMDGVAHRRRGGARTAGDRGRGDRRRQHGGVGRRGGRSGDRAGDRGRAGDALRRGRGLGRVRVPGRRRDVGPRRRAADGSPLRPEGTHRAGRGSRGRVGSRGARHAARRPAGLGPRHRSSATAADRRPRRRLTCRSTRSSPAGSRRSPASPASAGSRRSASATARSPSRAPPSSSRPRADPHTVRVELEPGEIAIPGLTDAHLHVIDAALAMTQVDLSTAPTLDEGLERIAAAARRVPAPGWIFGGGWDQRRWGAWPTAAALERVAPGRLVALHSFDHHCLWVSRAALDAAGIDRSTADPEGGIVRRTADGEPEGALLENATSLVEHVVPAPDRDTVARAIQALGHELLALGVVGAHDPRFLAPDPSNTAFDMYMGLADAGDLPFRVHVGVRAEGLDDAIARGFRSGDLLGGAESRRAGRLTMGWLKLFADGTLASRTAALLEPVGGRHGSRGMFTTHADEMAELATRAAAAGIATKIHSIGDAAVRTSLDILGPTAPQVKLMPRLEHVQLCARRRPGAVRGARRRRVGPAGPPAGRRGVGAAPVGCARRGERLHVAQPARCGCGGRLRDGRARRADRPVARNRDGGPAPRSVVGRGRRRRSAPTRRSPSSRHSGRRRSGRTCSAKDPLGGRLVPGARADLIVLPAAPRDSGERGAGVRRGQAARRAARRRGRDRALTRGRQRPVTPVNGRRLPSATSRPAASMPSPRAGCGTR